MKKRFCYYLLALGSIFGLMYYLMTSEIERNLFFSECIDSKHTEYNILTRIEWLKEAPDNYNNLHFLLNEVDGSISLFTQAELYCVFIKDQKLVNELKGTINGRKLLDKITKNGAICYTEYYNKLPPNSLQLSYRQLEDLKNRLRKKNQPVQGYPVL